MARVKIKTTNKDERRKLELLEILSKNDIYLLRIIQANDGFVAITATDQDLDKIFNNATDTELRNKHFTPQIPPQLKANRSVLLTKIDSHISGREEEDILEEIKAKNEWVTDIISVNKFPSGTIIKVTFSDSQQAKKAQTAGIKLFSLKVPDYNIKQDAYHHINVCLKCYSLDSHNTNQCEKEATYKICSECATEGHTWRDCSATEKKCINCSGNHGTMSMRCAAKKELINMKRKETENPTTYRDITTKKITLANEPRVTTTIDNNTHARIFTIIMHAHFMNIDKPGTYEEQLKKTLEANDLPPINIPDLPNSENVITKVFKTNNQAEANKGREEKQTKQTESRQQPEEEKGREQQTKQKEKPTETVKQGETSESIKSGDFGLKIYTQSSVGWPKGTLTLKQINKNIKEGKYKYTYTDKRVEEDEIMNMMANNIIELSRDCFQVLEDSIFKKIRNGLTKEYTPPQRSGSRQRIHSK